ncbi:MAG TPA: type II toxin-antitoxin system prevent-host-death family antitoxin [Candidatus Binatia bacterium]|jgi:antitoxin YefM
MVKVMGAISFNRFRKNLSKVTEEVVENEEPLTVTRADGKDFVVVPLREFESWKETLHLLSSPKNAKRLRESMAEIETEIARRHR